MKQLIKSFLNRIGIGAYLFPKTPQSDINKLEYLKTSGDAPILDVAVRANGSDKMVFNQIFVVEEYKTVVEFMRQFKKEGLISYTKYVIFQQVIPTKFRYHVQKM